MRVTKIRSSLLGHSLARPLSAFFFLMWMLGGGQELSAMIAEPSELLWRSPDQDGVNVAHLLQRLGGNGWERKAVADAVGADGKVSLLQIKKGLDRLAVPCALHSCGFDESFEALLPAIAYLEDPRTGRGGFVLVFRRSDSEVEWIDGGLVTLEVGSREEFVRRWVGPLLSLKPSGSRQAVLPLAASLISVGGYLGIRCRRRRLAFESRSPA